MARVNDLHQNYSAKTSSVSCRFGTANAKIARIYASKLSTRKKYYICLKNMQARQAALVEQTDRKLEQQSSLSAWYGYRKQDIEKQAVLMINAINRVHFFVQQRLLLGEMITRAISSKNSLQQERVAFERVVN